jgi:hypothetical protein
LKKSERFYCPKFFGNITKEECSPGQFRDCKKCPQFLKTTLPALSEEKKKPPKSQKAKPLDSEEISKLFSPLTKKDLQRIFKTLEIKTLSETAVARLEYCKDYIIMGVETLEKKKKRVEISEELNTISIKANLYLQALKKLSATNRYQIEQFLYPPEQPDGLILCPLCDDEFKTVALLENHLKLSHKESVGGIMKKPNNADIDVLNRSCADAQRISRAAAEALRNFKKAKNKGGRPPKIVFKECQKVLSKIFLEATGENPKKYYDYIEKKYTGRFQKFINAFLKTPVHHPSGITTLGKIEKNLKLPIPPKIEVPRIKYAGFMPAT